MSYDYNTIDGLLVFLEGSCADRRWAKAIRALVVERDALKQRVAELEALSKPVYISHGQRVESIDLRERLVCAIWPEMLRIFEKTDTTGANWDLVRINARAQALRDADEMIDAMRKGEA